MSLSKNTVLSIAAAIMAGFAIYSYMEPTTKKAQPQKKKESMKRGLQKKTRSPSGDHEEKSSKKHLNKGKKKQGHSRPAPANGV